MQYTSFFRLRLWRCAATGAGGGRHALERITLAYIFLPCVLFCFGWLTLPLGVLVCALLLAGVLYAFCSVGDMPAPEKDDGTIPNRPWRTALNLTALGAVVVIVVLYSGIGACSFQVLDYALKHNSFLKDLMEYPWPLAYGKTGPRDLPAPLATYIAFYLPSALVGKILGWNAANFFSIVWAILGIYLAVLWFLRLVGTTSFLYGMLFLFFGGLDLLGWELINGHFLPNVAHRTLDYWLLYGTRTNPAVHASIGDIIWPYGSNMTFITQGIHHVLPGWLIVLMVMYQVVRQRSAANLIFLWSAAPLGSAFVALGMLPYLPVCIYETRGKHLFSFQNMVSAPVLLGISGLFFLSNKAEYPAGWLWEFQDLTKSWPFLLLFYLVEFGIYAAFCPVFLTDPRSQLRRIWWWVSIACLLALPWYRLGAFCDLTSKGAVPSLLVFQVYLATSMRDAKARWERYQVRVLVCLLLLGALTGANELARGMSHGLKMPPPSARVAHINDLKPKNVAAQLYGDFDSFFWKYLAKSSQLH